MCDQFLLTIRRGEYFEFGQGYGTARSSLGPDSYQRFANPWRDKVDLVFNGEHFGIGSGFCQTCTPTCRIDYGTGGTGMKISVLLCDGITHGQMDMNFARFAPI